MRVVFFSSMRGAPWGGSEELWASAAQAALEDGHQVCVCVFDWQPRAASLRSLEDRGAKIVTRPLRPSRLEGFLHTPAWIGHLDSFDPEVMCLNQGSVYECVGRRSTRPLLGWLAQRGNRTRVVNIMHFNRPRHDLQRRTAARMVRLLELCHVNAFVAERNIKEAAETLRFTVPRALVVRNPVNLKDDSELAWPEGESESSACAKFACVGRLHVDAKGQDLLLDVLSSPPWKARPWTLSLFGEGKDESALRERASHLGLSDRIIFAGSTSDIRALWKGHHLLVLPSRAEGTPLAMVEAMLLARPCMVTDVGGCTEWVRDGIEGWVAERADPSAIGAAMERAWAARPGWSMIGHAARTRALQLHDPRPGKTLLNMLVGEKCVSTRHS